MTTILFVDVLLMILGGALCLALCARMMTKRTFNYHAYAKQLNVGLDGGA